MVEQIGRIHVELQAYSPRHLPGFAKREVVIDESRSIAKARRLVAQGPDSLADCGECCWIVYLRTASSSSAARTRDERPAIRPRRPWRSGIPSPIKRIQAG